MILEKEQWTDKSIDFLTTDIIEYDMREGGFSIIKENSLLPQSTIDEIGKIPTKDARHKHIGKLERVNKELRDGKTAGFRQYRLMFGEANELTDDDILSVKKDAIFVKKYCYNTIFGSHIVFVEKHKYTAYMRLNGMELYMNEETIDTKGIKDEKVVPLHKDGILVVIRKFMTLLSQYNTQGAIKYMVKTMNQYKRLELPVQCYREFNAGSYYRILQGDMEQRLDDVGEVMKPQLIVDYNYVNILVPMLNIAIG